MSRTVRVDPHLHTAASYDGETTPGELLARAEAVGLDAVADRPRHRRGRPHRRRPRRGLPGDGAVVPHPFQRSRHGAGAGAITNVDAIEVYNAHTLVNLRNEQAERYADAEGYPKLGGSDAHRPGSIGLAATEIRLRDGGACTPASVLDALREGRTVAVGRRTSAWQYVTKLVANARHRTPSLL